MQLVPISTDVDIIVVASAVRNVCNATLSLLFTVALLIWGLLVNRKQAWRTDGGTAAFGAGALILAVVSTALNFLFVNKEDDFVWLPGLMWAVVLWQSFLGWWWWVGSGSGSGLTSEEDVEDKLRREAKRQSRMTQARQRRKDTKSKARRVWRGVSGVFGSSSSTHDPEENDLVRRNRSRDGVRRRSSTPDDDLAEPSSPVDSIASTMSMTSAISFTTLPRALPRFIHEWYAFVRKEHVAAARKQAAERVRRIRELERNGQRRAPRSGSGWGLGSFGWRIATPVASPGDNEHFSGDESRPRRRATSRPGRRRAVSPGEDIELQDRTDPSSSITAVASRSSRRDRSLSSEYSSEDEDTTTSRARRDGASGDSRVDDVRGETQNGRGNRRRGTLRIDIPPSPTRMPRASASVTSPPLARRSPRTQPAPPERPTNSVWWWGPLAQWRLRDSTTYS